MGGPDSMYLARMATKWIKLGESIADLHVGENGLREFEVGGKKICVAVTESQEVKACAATCPHASAPMAEGWLDAMGHIVCPRHRYRFCLDRGLNVSGEGFHLKRYMVEVREDGVYVNLGAKPSWL